MAANLAWSDVSLAQLQHLDSMSEVAAIKRELARIFELGDIIKNSKGNILADMYYYAWSFCKEQKFSEEKTSTFLSILKDNHIQSISELWPMETSFENFKSVLLTHSVHRPPFSVGVFSLQDVKLITDYVVDTYFRHYKLYKYTFVKRNIMNLTTKKSLVQAPPLFPPLSEAFTDIDTAAEAVEEEEDAETDDGRLSPQVDPNVPPPEPPPLASLPDNLQAPLEATIEHIKEQMEAKIKEREEQLLAKIQALESELANVKK
eukprot:GFYU01003404.1.p1 GENE.GFYU01003404.1~~GFYU01003404.1.p1  ORF type:complete len:261 (-),score=84.73 GFYU01003404.1:659-1441(-)